MQDLDMYCRLRSAEFSITNMKNAKNWIILPICTLFDISLSLAIKTTGNVVAVKLPSWDQAA